MCTLRAMFVTCINLLFKIFALIFSIFDTIAGVAVVDISCLMSAAVIAVETAWCRANWVEPCLMPTAANILQVSLDG